MTKNKPWHVGANDATNLTRSQVQAFCKRVLNTPAYVASLEARLLNGTLAPGIETLLWHYAYGKPVDNVNLNVATGDLSSLSKEELLELARKTVDDLEDAAKMEEELKTMLSTHPTVQ